MDEIRQRQVTERVALAVGACLDRFFEETLPEAIGIKIAVVTECTGEYQEGEGVVSLFHFHIPGPDDPIEVRMKLDGYGGNVYFADVSVNGHPEERCPVTVPDGADATAASPGELEVHAQELCDYILTKLKLIVGERELREATEESGGWSSRT